MVKWIAHRGESFDSPENTMTAFSLAAKRGADGIECDLRLTADGKVVVAHDPTTVRMGNRVLSIAESSWSELSKITVSGIFETEYPGEKIPLFSETFSVLKKDMEYYIELKGDDPELVDAAVEIIKTSNADLSQLVFISFSRQLISKIKKVMPPCRALLLDKLDRDGRIATAEELIAEINSLGIDGIDGGNHPDITPELIRKIKNAGMIFAVWTVDNPHRAKQLIDMGADVITSNCAAKLKRIFLEQNF